MSKAAVHTTIRELSHAISRKESVIHQADRAIEYVEWHMRSDPEKRKEHVKKSQALRASAEVGLPELRTALAALAVVVAKELA